MARREPNRSAVYREGSILLICSGAIAGHLMLSLAFDLVFVIALHHTTTALDIVHLIQPEPAPAAHSLRSLPRGLLPSASCTGLIIDNLASRISLIAYQLLPIQRLPASHTLVNVL